MKKAIVLGGTHDHVRLIQILRERGFFVVLVDYLSKPIASSYVDDHIQESALDIKAVLDLAKKLKPELVITACIDQALPTMAYVCEELNLPCYVDFQTALRLTNKVYMKEVFLKNSVLTSKFVVFDQFRTNFDTGLRFPLVVKPADANGSKGVLRVDRKEALEQSIQTAYSYTRSGYVVVEEFLDGIELSVDVVVKNFEPSIIMVTKNIKMRENKNVFTILENSFPGTDNLSLETEKNLSDIARKIACAYGLKNGPLLIQVIASQNNRNIYTIETSARLGGGSKHHLLKAVTGFDFLEWFTNLFFSEIGDVSLQTKLKFASIKYVYAKPATIGEFVNFDHLVKFGIIQEYYYYKSVGTSVTNHISSSDRVAGFLVIGESRSEVNQKIEKAISEISVRDITGADIILR